MSGTARGEQSPGQRFDSAYDAVLAQWPEPPEALDVPSTYGTTRVHVCGSPEGTPLMLLHGGGATSTVWFANVGALADRHRIFAPDLIGDAGRSVQDGTPIRGVPALVGWLDSLCDSLETVALAGHSYGGWVALTYALHAPERVERLALIDPTDCFAGLASGYRLRAAPLLLRPSAARMERLLRWEVGGQPLDPAWLRLVSAGADLPRARVVMPRRPTRQQLQALTVPTRVILAARSRAHDAQRVADEVHRSMPVASTVVLDQASHHTLPQERPDQLNQELAEFLSGPSQSGGRSE